MIPYRNCILEQRRSNLISLVSPEMEEYCVENSTPVPDYVANLARITEQKMPVPEMLSGPIEASLLQLLVWILRARRVLEIGTFTGYSALMIAEALPEDGILITCEIDPDSASLARKYFKRSPHGRKIELRLGPALETVQTLDAGFDLIFIDAEKTEYPDYYEASLAILSPTGIIAIDNALWGGRVLEPASDSDYAISGLNERIRKDNRVRQVLLPLRDGLMLVRRV